MDIIRPQTEQEKRDFIVAGQTDYKKIFLAKLADKAMDFQKKYLPYCQRCAQLDFQDKFDSVAKEIERAEGAISYTDPRLKSVTIDFDDYASASRWDLVAESEIIENRVINGERQPVIIGYWKDYKCKNRKCACSVEIPKSIYDASKNKK
jgi:hypothetical protein